MPTIITANLNGIRSAASKGFFDWMRDCGADVVCVQEVRAQYCDLHETLCNPEGYKGYFYLAQRKGYAGVGMYCRTQPLRVIEGVGDPQCDEQGRFLRADFEGWSVVSVYVPSGSASAERQESKFAFLAMFRPVMDALLREGRPIVVCGDWNIAHREIDLKNWQGNRKNSGFLPEERAWLDALYASGWVDVYRSLYPDAAGEGYTWWSNRGQAYANNVGWRIDLHVATPSMAAKAVEGGVIKDRKYSDHAPLWVRYGVISSL
ncbi:exodeoxyribonuclease III [Candidatus Symbiobacter mobilis]|nr:exodeoxyribonuclease III [Candidatus Symbiobacter mobilis]